jgi:hypothetical protein
LILINYVKCSCYCFIVLLLLLLKDIIMDPTPEDLRAFEKRLTEVVNYLQPKLWRYRSLFLFCFLN